jgi:hypothetical protein
MAATGEPKRLPCDKPLFLLRSPCSEVPKKHFAVTMHQGGKVVVGELEGDAVRDAMDRLLVRRYILVMLHFI